MKNEQKMKRKLCVWLKNADYAFNSIDHFDGINLKLYRRMICTLGPNDGIIIIINMQVFNHPVFFGYNKIREGRVEFVPTFYFF